MVFDAFLGPHYSYINKIPNPETLGAGGGGSMEQMSKNVSALLDYVNILAEGCNKSAKSKGLCEGFKNKEGFDIFPLGNKFFLKTLGKCDNGEKRYLYINNRPAGLGNLRGVVPGIIEDTFSLNPVNLFMGFSKIGDPKCAKVAGQTINDKSQKGNEIIILADGNVLEQFAIYFKKLGYKPKIPKKITSKLIKKYLN